MVCGANSSTHDEETQAAASNVWPVSAKLFCNHFCGWEAKYLIILC